MGNAFTLQDVEKKGLDPLALRYFYLTGHYRKPLNFIWEALEGAQTALNKLRHLAAGWDEPAIGCAEYEEKFKSALEDDLNLPEALAVVWDLVKSNYPSSAKKKSLLRFDEVLGLDLAAYRVERVEITDEARDLVTKRERLREEKRFAEADKIREDLGRLGYKVLDTDDGVKLIRE